MGLESTSLWPWLKKARLAAHERRLSLHLCRVENSAGAGMADVNGCLSRNEFWMELKAEPRPKHPETYIKFKVRESQIEWHKRRQEAGGTSYYVVQVGSGLAARRYILWADEDNGRKLEAGVREWWLERHCELRKYDHLHTDRPLDFIRYAAHVHML